MPGDCVCDCVCFLAALLAGFHFLLLLPFPWAVIRYVRSLSSCQQLPYVAERQSVFQSSLVEGLRLFVLGPSLGSFVMALQPRNSILSQTYPHAALLGFTLFVLTTSELHVAVHVFADPRRWRCTDGCVFRCPGPELVPFCKLLCIAMGPLHTRSLVEARLVSSRYFSSITIAAAAARYLGVIMLLCH